MNSLVLELQNLASSSTSNLPELLRKSKLVAFKLGLGDFQRWIDFELEGYKEVSDIPHYRIVHCELRAVSRFQGLVPVNFGDMNTANIFKKVEIKEGVGSLKAVLEASEGGTVQLPLMEIEKSLLQNSE